MANPTLVGRNYTTADLVAKVTGRARYAEDFRADGMLFCKLLLSPVPHCRVRGIDTRAALALPGVKAVLTADDFPAVTAPEGGLPPERALTSTFSRSARICSITAALRLMVLPLSGARMGRRTQPCRSRRPGT